MGKEDKIDGGEAVPTQPKKPVSVWLGWWGYMSGSGGIIQTEDRSSGYKTWLQVAEGRATFLGTSGISCCSGALKPGLGTIRR